MRTKVLFVNMNDNNNSLGSRFAEQRIKLKLSQAAVAERCGVSREMVGKYERDAATPGGDVLAAFGKLGADLYYILVGREKNSPQPIMLAPEEVLFIDGYRSLHDEDKRWFQLMLDAKIGQTINKGTNKAVRKKTDVPK